MLSHNLSSIQFITYSQIQSQFHDPNIKIYHANLVNFIQNINKLYKNVSPNMGNKTPQIISHNHIKIKETKKHKSKTRKHQEHSILSTNSHKGIN